ncbi:FAD-binding oxidoreductase [Ascidiimonas sp. W6]|uniref:FAD-binding oxidoreductase n=1 Tax=Ascidiimonas meishanensis TaxID=3128903 RepID=UPI0030ECCC7D
MSDFITIVGEENVIFEEDKLYQYATDHSSRKSTLPLCVVKPNSTNEVSQIVKVCNRKNLGITIRAGGSGVSGGSVSNSECIILSIERLNKILTIDAINRYVITQAGVVTQILQDKLLETNMCFPQNISSASMSCIGGNVAISSGSPKSLKYGSTKNYVLNLEVVLPDGRIIWTGKNIEKNATGYNLTQLFVGSEGTLGIITKVVLKIVPVQKELLMMVPFETSERLFNFVKTFFSQGFTASSLEFLDQNGYGLILEYLGEKNKFSNQFGGLLWIEFESPTDEENMNKATRLYNLILEYSNYEPLIAQSVKEIESLWKYRKKIGEAAINYAEFKDLDVVVPRDKIDEMFKAINFICESLQLEFIVIGHIGNGNFHINIFNSNEDSMWEENICKCTTQIFEKAIEMGGEISGEHGIGTYNRSFFNQFTSNTNIKIMAEIKKIFDPKNILNSNNLFIEQH